MLQRCSGRDFGLSVVTSRVVVDVGYSQATRTVRSGLLGFRGLGCLSLGFRALGLGFRA